MGDRMGRTNPTFRDALRAIEDRWQNYRRALRNRDQAHFDQLFAHARNHADASGLLNHQNPIVPTLVSIDLNQERHLNEHDDRLDDLEETLEILVEQPESSVHQDDSALGEQPDTTDQGTESDRC